MHIYRMNEPIYERRLEVVLISNVALIQCMDLRGLTIRGLAEKAGVSKSTISNLTSGARRTVRPATARQIAEALGMTPDDLFVARIVHSTSRMPERIGRSAA